jgi:hypothetical protein
MATLEQLLSEKELAKSLGMSRGALADYRRQGCPWVKIGRKVYYFEPDFMDWLLKHQKRIADLNQTLTQIE